MRRRKALRTPLLALVGVGAVASALLALPQPARSDVLASRTAHWLADYRLVASREQLDGHAVRGLCVSTWFKPLARSGRRIRASYAVLSTGAQVFDSHRELQVIHGALLTTPEDQIALAGCPHALALMVDRVLARPATLIVRRGRFDNRAVTEFRLTAKIVLDVAPASDRPLAVVVHARHRTFSSMLTFEYLSPRRERALKDRYELDRQRVERACRRPLAHKGAGGPAGCGSSSVTTAV